MSEIFSWLKRTEMKRGEGLADPAAATVQYFPSKPNGGAGQPEIVQESPVSAMVPAKPHDGRSFEVAYADPRIKSVLDPLTLVGEQFRVLRAKLSLMQRQRGTRTLLITSSVPDEGKTFTACCLAAVLSQEPGKRILLVDADLRKPKAGRTVGLANAAQYEGLSQILRGISDAESVILTSRNSNLSLLPSGEVPQNPVELLSSPNLDRSLKRLADLYDWIIIDSPPALTLADPTVISPYCDASLLVVRANQTPSKIILESIDRLGREKICGILLNRVQYIRGSRYYYRYYHHKPERSIG